MMNLVIYKNGHLPFSPFLLVLIEMVQKYMSLYELVQNCGYYLTKVNDLVSFFCFWFSSLSKQPILCDRKFKV